MLRQEVLEQADAGAVALIADYCAECFMLDDWGVLVALHADKFRDLARAGKRAEALEELKHTMVFAIVCAEYHGMPE